MSICPFFSKAATLWDAETELATRLLLYFSNFHGVDKQVLLSYKSVLGVGTESEPILVWIGFWGVVMLVSEFR